MEANDEVELGEKFKLFCLIVRENFGGGEVFQIDFEVIRMIRSENFSLSFAENVSKLMILRRDIGKIRSFHKFCEVSLNVQRTKTEFKIVGAHKF